MYLSLHSIGQYLLFPWSYTLEKSEDYDKLNTFAQSFKEKLNSLSEFQYEVIVDILIILAFKTMSKLNVTCNITRRFHLSYIF